MPASKRAKESAHTPSPEAIRLFEGLAWPVPTAFAGALADFRFEQGDVLYADPGAYGPLSGPPDAPRALQIEAPKRSTRGAPVEGDADRRQASWDAEVVLEDVDLRDGTRRRHTTTQGRLFTMLWRGDDDWLDPEREAPPLPLTARDLATRLPELVGPDPDEAEAAKRGTWRFVFVVDESSDASRVKAEGVREALRTLGPVASRDERVGDSALPDADAFHPLLVVRHHSVRKTDAASMEAALRGALYGGQATPGDETATDRFSVSRHGRLRFGAD